MTDVTLPELHLRGGDAIVSISGGGTPTREEAMQAYKGRARPGKKAPTKFVGGAGHFQRRGNKNKATK